MPSTLLGPRQAGLLCLLATVVGWGLNWPVMKFLLREWPPLSARGTAGVTTAPALVLLAALCGQRLAVPVRPVGRLDWARDPVLALARRRPDGATRLHQAGLAHDPGVARPSMFLCSCPDSSSMIVVSNIGPPTAP